MAPQSPVNEVLQMTYTHLKRWARARVYSKNFARWVFPLFLRATNNARCGVVKTSLADILCGLYISSRRKHKLADNVFETINARDR